MKNQIFPANGDGCPTIEPPYSYKNSTVDRQLVGYKYKLQSASLISIFEKLERLENLLKDFKVNRKWIDIKNAVEYTGISKATLDRNIRAGRLRCSKINRKRIFKIEWLDCFMEGK